MPDFYGELINKLATRVHSPEEVSRLKRDLCKRHGRIQIPTSIGILLNATEQDLPRLRYLKTKPTRTISGVAVVAVMTKPIACKHGKCSYCPGGPLSEFGDTPQSYTGREPATMRAMRAGFDPYLQVFNRLEQYTCLGHATDKVEMIVMGGTFPSFPRSYQEGFMSYCLKGLNDFSSKFISGEGVRLAAFKDFFELPGDIGSEPRTKKLMERIRGIKGKADLAKEQKKNEKSRCRLVALCIETRPDYCKKKHIKEMLNLGATRIELGVQSVHEKALLRINRGHTVADSITATQLLKDAYLKVGYHMMPGLPGESRNEDIEGLEELFSNPDFRPDSLKLYPCMVIKGTGLYDDWKKGDYVPLTTTEASQMIAKFKTKVPEYCRIMRVQRDIPTKVTEAGVDRTNLRQYVAAEIKARKLTCRCIHCREPRGQEINVSTLKISALQYEASKGKEYFISAEDKKTDLLAGYCRLRIPYKPFVSYLKSSAGVRELHVFGEAARIGEQGAIQHRGIGKELLRKAEEIAMAEGKKKLFVISGIGAREYFRQLGYRKHGFYMRKNME